MNKAKLRLASVSKSFIQNSAVVTILNAISVEFVQGNTYAITGASGTGKSTLLHIIAGLDLPTKGVVFFNDIAIANVSAKNFSLHLNGSIGLLFQSAYLIKELTVLENVMLPGLIGNKEKSNLKRRALSLLEQVNLSDKINSPPGELSGGQQQRVALARALINEPVFLIADEPTGNLDRSTAQAMISLFMDCRQKWGMGIIVSSHDTQVTERMDTVFELTNGALIKHHNDIKVCSPQKTLSPKQYR